MFVSPGFVGPAGFLKTWAPFCCAMALGYWWLGALWWVGWPPGLPAWHAWERTCPPSSPFRATRRSLLPAYTPAVGTAALLVLTLHAPHAPARLWGWLALAVAAVGYFTLYAACAARSASRILSI